MIDLKEMTVLIADDMRGMVNSIRSILKLLGYGKRFIPATNGEEAWQALRAELVDMAILDYNMPLMTGAELLSRIREDRELRFLPIVMVTAEANREFVAEAAESEIDAYVLKPITVKVLGDKVLNVIQNANNPPPMVYHLQNARRFEESGDLDGAIKEATLAMKANPKSTRPLRELGYYHLKKDQLAEAEKLLLKAAKLNKLDVIAFHYLGELYVRLNRIDDASMYYDKAVSISPRHVTRSVRFGKILIEKHEIKKAAKVFDKAMEISKEDLALREEIADFCIEKGAKEYGAKVLESIVKEDPARKEVVLRLGLTLKELKDFNKAVQYLTQAEIEDEGNLEVKMHIAEIYLELGMPIRAEKPLKQILQADQENEKAKKLLARCI